MLTSRYDLGEVLHDLLSRVILQEDLTSGKTPRHMVVQNLDILKNMNIAYVHPGDLLFTDTDNNMIGAPISTLLYGQEHQVTIADNGGGTALIGTVQDIDVTSSPTFDSPLFTGSLTVNERLLLVPSLYTTDPTSTSCKFEMFGDNLYDTLLNVRRSDNLSYGPGILLQKSEGTLNIPTSVKNGDILGEIYFSGYDGQTPSTNPWPLSAEIRASATENHIIGSHGTNLKFYTTKNGSTNLLQRLMIDNDGVTTISCSIQSNSITTGSLVVGGGVGISGNVYLGGDLNVTGTVYEPQLSVFGTTDASNITSGVLKVAGGASIVKSLYVGEHVFIGASGGDRNYLCDINTIFTSRNPLKFTNTAGTTGFKMNSDSSMSIHSSNNTVESKVCSFYNTQLRVDLTNNSTSTSTGALLVIGGAGVEGTLSANNLLADSGTIVLTTDSTSPGTGSLVVGGGLGVHSSVFVGGNLTVAFALNAGSLAFTGGTITSLADSTSTSSGALTVYGGVGIGKNITVGGIIDIQSTLESTSTSTGSLIVGGGAGIAKNLFVGGAINTQSTIESTSTSTGTLIVGGGAGIAGNLYVGGTTTTDGIIVNNSSNLNASITVPSTGSLYIDATDSYAQLIADGMIFMAQLHSALTATYYPSGTEIIGSGSGAISFVNEKVYLQNNAHITWSNGLAFSTTATFKFKVTFCDLSVFITDFFTCATGIYILRCYRYSNGDIAVVIQTPGGGDIQLSAMFNVPGLVLGVEYEFEVDYDVSVGGVGTRLFVDGIMIGTPNTTTVASLQTISNIMIGPNSGYNSSIYIRDVIIYNSIQHTTNYEPGYILALGGLELKPFGYVKTDYLYVRNSDDQTKVATLDINIDGSLGITARDTLNSSLMFVAPFSTTITAIVNPSSYATQPDASFGTATISNSKLTLTGYDLSYVRWHTTAFANTFTVKMLYTPNYSGMPTTTQRLIQMGTPGSSANIYILEHNSGGSGYLYTQTNNSNGFPGIMNGFAPWSPVSGTEYEFEINHDGTSGVTLFINGVQFGPKITGTCSRSNDQYIQFGTSLDSPGPQYYVNHSVRNVIIYNTIQHTSNYTPGYTMPESVGGINMCDGGYIKTDTLIVRSTINSTSTTTGSVNIIGGVSIEKNLYVGGILNAGSLAFTGATITSTVDSTSTSTGSLIVGGGAGIAKNLYVGGVMNASTGVFTSTINSTSSSSGSLTVVGGVGIRKDVIVGGNLSVTNNTSSNNSYVYSQLYFPPAVSGAIFYGTLTSTTNLDYVTNNLPMTGAISGTVTTVGGKTNISAGSSITYSEYDSGQLGGTVKFMFTPSWSGNPSSTQILFSITGGGSTINLSQSTNGQTYTTYSVYGSNMPLSSVWVPIAGTEYEIEYNWFNNWSGNAAININVYINGVCNDPLVLNWQDRISGTTLALSATGAYRNVILYNSAQHHPNYASTYTPGYSLNIMNFLNSNSILNLSTNTGVVQDWNNLTYSSKVYYTTASTSTSTGSLIVNGGIGAKGSIYASNHWSSNIGTPAAQTNLMYQAYDTQNNYIQNNIQNLSSGTGASCDYIATCNTGTDLVGYIDMGINSSGFTGTYGGANDGYLFVKGGATGGRGNLYVGTVTDTMNTYFTNGASNTNIMSVTSTGTNILVTTESTSSTTGALQISGGCGIYSNLNVGGVASVLNTTDSMSTNTGAMLISGGVGIAKTLYVGTSIISTNGVIQGRQIAGGTWWWISRLLQKTDSHLALKAINKNSATNVLSEIHVDITNYTSAFGTNFQYEIIDGVDEPRIAAFRGLVTVDYIHEVHGASHLDFGSGATHWQSFTLTTTAYLTYIENYLGISTSGGGMGSYTVKIYSGTGIGGTLLTTLTDASSPASYQWHGITLPTPLSVTAGTYTMAITAPSIPVGSAFSWSYGVSANYTSDVAGYVYYFGVTTSNIVTDVFVYGISNTSSTTYVSIDGTSDLPVWTSGGTGTWPTQYPGGTILLFDSTTALPNTTPSIGTLIINSTTQSTTSTTGSLVIGGGAGIAKTLYVGASIISTNGIIQGRQIAGGTWWLISRLLQKTDSHLTLTAINKNITTNLLSKIYLNVLNNASAFGTQFHYNIIDGTDEPRIAAFQSTVVAEYISIFGYLSEGINFLSNETHWQSFTVTSLNKYLTGINMYLYIAGQSLGGLGNFTVRIHEGTGTSGAIVYSTTSSANLSSCAWHPFTLSPPVFMVQGNVYTLAITSPATITAPNFFRWVWNVNSPYSGGVSDFPGKQFFFNVSISDIVSDIFVNGLNDSASTTYVNIDSTSDLPVWTSGGTGTWPTQYPGGTILLFDSTTALPNTTPSIGTLIINSTTQATTSTTGSIIIGGGAGIAKNLFVGGTARVGGAVTCPGIVFGTGSQLSWYTFQQSTITWTGALTSTSTVYYSKIGRQAHIFVPVWDQTAVASDSVMSTLPYPPDTDLESILLSYQPIIVQTADNVRALGMAELAFASLRIWASVSLGTFTSGNKIGFYLDVTYLTYS